MKPVAVAVLLLISSYSVYAQPTPPPQFLDQLVPESQKPEFPTLLESNRFTFRTTQSDPEPSHNIAPESVQPIIPALDAAFDIFLRIYGKIDPAPPLRQLVDVYNFVLDPRFDPLALAYTSPTDISLNVLPKVFADQCNAARTIAHELFHRVQKAHGAFGPGFNVATEAYWIEGTAEYATILGIGGNAFLDWVPLIFNEPRTSIFNRGYEAVLFWLYLDERFRELSRKNANSSGVIIDRLLNRFDTSKKPFHTFLPAELAKVYRAGSKQRGALKISGAKPDAAFLQEWHLTNLFTVLGGGTTRLSYDPIFVGTDACGVTRNFPGLAAQGSATITDNDTTFSAGGFSEYGGASYYRFAIGPGVSEINIAVRSRRPIVTTIVGRNGQRNSFVRSSAKSFQRTFRFRPGSVDQIFVVVGGANNKRSAPASEFTISVNGGTQPAETGPRVLAVATLSDDPNDPTGDPVNLAVTIGGKTVQTEGPEEARRTTIESGVQVVTADVAALSAETGRQLKVGFVSIALTASGQVFRCAPAAPNGQVSFPFQIRAQNPNSQSDFVVGVRVVPVEAGPLTSPESGCDIVA